MRNYILLPLVVACLLFSAISHAESEGGCAPEFRALADNAIVEFTGKGELDIVVLTDPLCWHCRLAHKLLGEYPELYRSVKLSFFPRKNFIGSDMAAWIIEDGVGTDKLKALVDFGYDGLKQPKTEDLAEARMIVLTQFTQAFPYLLEGTTLPELFVRLERDRSPHVLKSAALADAAKMPGTPILIAGQNLVLGYGPGAWIKALEKKDLCK